MNKFNFNKLTPFKWFVLENFPFIEADFDALTNWQLFCKLGNEMNKIINSENTLGTQMENVTNAFIDLQNYVNNYFENLDVQDEINNKLNEMAQDGTLQEIIAEYLNSKAIFGFINVAEMKNATNLINGSYAETLGYYSINDNGKALYKIRTITNEDIVNEETIIALNNETLIAELVIKDNITAEMFGCYGDNIHNDTEKLQDVIDYSIKNKIKLISRKDKKYKITETITIDGVFECDFENAEINSNFDDDIIAVKVTDNQGYDENKDIYWSYGGFIKNLIINGNNQGIGIKVYGQKKMTFNNIEIINCNIGLRTESVTECVFDTIRFQKCNTGLYQNGSDAIFTNIFGRFCNIGIDAITYTEIINSHFWVREEEPEFINSIYARTQSGIRLENAQIDSYKTGIYLAGNGSYPVHLSGLWQQPDNSTELYTLFDVSHSTYNSNGSGIRLYNFTATCKSTEPYARFSDVESDVFKGFIDYKSCRFLRIQKFPLTTHFKLVDVVEDLEEVENRIDVNGNVWHITFTAKVLNAFKYKTIAKLPTFTIQDFISSGIPLKGKSIVGITSEQYSISNTQEQFIGAFVSRNRAITIATQDNQDIPIGKYFTLDFTIVIESNNILTE